MAWQNEYRSGSRSNQQQKSNSRRKSSSVNQKRSQKKRKTEKQFASSSRNATAMDFSERRRQARERGKKRPEKRDNVIEFPTQHQAPAVKVRSPRSGTELSFVLIVRLMILAVGIGAIAGTILSFLDRDQYLSSSPSASTEVVTSTPTATPPPPPPLLPLNQEISTLKNTFQTLASEHPQLNPGAFIVDLDSGEYLNLQGETEFSAASMIKVPVLIAFFQAWDEGKVQLDERLTMTADVKASGAGNMQYEPLGTDYLALETAAKMIIISDNTATNMLIKRLGGKEVLNQLFAEWGLEHTRIRNPLPDLDGTNTTTPKELVELLARLNKGELVSARSRDQIFRIMRETRTRTLLPQGLGEGATIAHKTGDIGSLVGDVGIIDRPSGKRYLAAIMVERPHNDRQANELIREYSRAAYQYFHNQEKNSFIE